MLGTKLTDDFTKHFGCLMGRYDLYRLRLAKHMHENHQDKTVLSYHMHHNVLSFLNCGGLDSLFAEDLEWARQNLPITPQQFKTTKWGSVNWFEAVERSEDIYNQFFIDIVSETDHNSPDWFTEKTYKPLMLRRPFILWTGRGALHQLQQLGFKTFNGFIDERYDLVFNNQERFKMVLAEIDRISKMSLDELREINQQIEPLLVHNQNRIYELWETMNKTPWKAFFLI